MGQELSARVHSSSKKAARYAVEPMPEPQPDVENALAEQPGDRTADQEPEPGDRTADQRATAHQRRMARLSATEAARKYNDHQMEFQRLTGIAGTPGLTANRRKFCPLNPRTTPWLVRWDAFIIALLVFTTTVTPYEVGFMGEPEVGVLFVVNRIVDMGFIVDMVLQFHLAYVDESSNQMVFEYKRIAHRYLSGWFVVDLTSVLPFDSLSFVMRDRNTNASEQLKHLKMLRVVRLLRLIKLLRLMRSARILRRLESRLAWSELSVKLLQCSCSILVVIHWVACAWGAISSLFIEPGIEAENWINKLDLHARNPVDSYVYAIEFAVMAMAFQYGDVQPVGVGQRILGLTCMFVGGSVYVYMVGAICEALSSVDPASKSFKQIKDTLNLYLAEIRLDRETRRECRRFILKSKDMMRHQYYQDVLLKLSPLLRSKLARHCHREWISKVDFFNCDDALERRRFRGMVALRMQRAAFIEMEVIQRAGCAATALYIIQGGLVGVSGRVRRKGACFGLEMVQAKGMCTFTAVAMTYVDTMFLTRDDLLEVLQLDVPLTKKKIRMAAFKMVLKQFVRQVGIAHRLQCNTATHKRRQARNRWKSSFRKMKTLKRRNSVSSMVGLKTKGSMKGISDLKITPAQKKELAKAMYDTKRVDKEEIAARLPSGVSFAESQQSVMEDRATQQKKSLDAMQSMLDARVEKLENKIERLVDARLSNIERLLRQLVPAGDGGANASSMSAVVRPDGKAMSSDSDDEAVVPVSQSPSGKWRGMGMDDSVQGRVV